MHIIIIHTHTPTTTDASVMPILIKKIYNLREQRKEISCSLILN
jgi:hypothetical protein